MMSTQVGVAALQARRSVSPSRPSIADASAHLISHSQWMHWLPAYRHLAEAQAGDVERLFFAAVANFTLAAD